MLIDDGWSDSEGQMLKSFEADPVKFPGGIKETVSMLKEAYKIYFKTEPNAKSRDVVLKEYSIEKVIDKQNVKILVPDNNLPTRELQFNSMMIDYPVSWECHIVKSEFWKVFGEGTHPDPHDYLYFST